MLEDQQLLPSGGPSAAAIASSASSNNNNYGSPNVTQPLPPPPPNSLTVLQGDENDAAEAEAAQGEGGAATTTNTTTNSATRLSIGSNSENLHLRSSGEKRLVAAQLCVPLAAELEQHLEFALPSCCACCCGSGPLRPAGAFALNTLFFFIPLLWSALNPLFFADDIPVSGSFDGCFYLNATTTTSSSSYNNNATTDILEPMSFVDCIRCNNNKGTVPLPSGTAADKATPLSLGLIIIRLFCIVSLASHVFSRVHFERLLCVRLLSFGIIPEKSTNATVLSDLLSAITLSAAIAYQLSFLSSFAPPDASDIDIGPCLSVPDDATAAPFYNKTVFAHFNQTTVASLYRVTTPTGMAFSFLASVLPFLLGPVMQLYRQLRDPFYLISAARVFGDRDSTLIRDFASQAGNLRRMHVTRMPLLRIVLNFAKSMRSRLDLRGIIIMILDFYLLFVPFPVAALVVIYRYQQEQRPTTVVMAVSGQEEPGGDEAAANNAGSGSYAAVFDSQKHVDFTRTAIRDYNFELQTIEEFAARNTCLDYMSGLFTPVLIILIFIVQPLRPDITFEEQWQKVQKVLEYL